MFTVGKHEVSGSPNHTRRSNQHKCGSDDFYISKSDVGQFFLAYSTYRTTSNFHLSLVGGI